MKTITKAYIKCRIIIRPVYNISFYLVSYLKGSLICNLTKCHLEFNIFKYENSHKKYHLARGIILQTLELSQNYCYIDINRKRMDFYELFIFCHAHKENDKTIFLTRPKDKTHFCFRNRFESMSL